MDEQVVHTRQIGVAQCGEEFQITIPSHLSLVTLLVRLNVNNSLSLNIAFRWQSDVEET